jgi:ankyrin repeat protein
MKSNTEKYDSTSDYLQEVQKELTAFIPYIERLKHYLTVSSAIIPSPIGRNDDYAQSLITDLILFPTSKGYTGLHFAIFYNQPHIAAILIGSGANVNAKTNEGLTSLHLAARNGYIHLFNLLLLQGADVNAKTNEGLTPLHFAAQNGHLEACKELIRFNAVIDAKTNRGMTPLHYAAQKGYTYIFRALLVLKPRSVNATTTEGSTPLHCAVQNGHLEACKELIKFDATINSATLYGLTPLILATQREDLSILKLLLSTKKITSTEIENALFITIETLNCPIVQALIDEVASISTETNQLTPLHYATSLNPRDIDEISKHIKIMQILIKSGANLNATNINGFTPLHFAIQTHAINIIDIVQLLIDNGANINAKTNEGLTPLHLAAKLGYFQSATILRQSGADCTIKDDNGLTAWEYANKNKYHKLAKAIQPAAFTERDSSTEQDESSQTRVEAHKRYRGVNFDKSSLSYIVHPTSQDEVSMSYPPTNTSKKHKSR